MGGSKLPELQSKVYEPGKAGEYGPSRIRGDKLWKEMPYGDGIDDLYKAFKMTVDKSPDLNCMGQRDKGPDGKPSGPFKWSSFKQVHDKIMSIGAGISALPDVKPADTFGLYAVNSMEWQQVNIAGFSRGLTCVPIYDTLGDHVVEYELNHAEVKIIFVEQNSAQNVLSVAPKCPDLKYLVIIGAGADVSSVSAPEGVKVMTLSDLIDGGDASSYTPSSLGADGLAYIMYTSGTTGNPKGVRITQRSIACATHCTIASGVFPLQQGDRYLSFLPLAHIFGTVVEFGIWAGQGSVGYFSGNIRLLKDDILTLKPTIFVGVPRVFQRFYDVTMDTVGKMGFAKRTLVKYMYSKEVKACRKGKHSKFQKKINKGMGDKFMGGECRLVLSGAAPLPVHVQDFLLAAIGCHVVQGYGMTENMANCTLAMMEDWRSGHVGPPQPVVEIRLQDVKEMNYTTDGDVEEGEIACRGVNNCDGYHKNPEATAEIFTEDGFMLTGDIGRWNKDGTLSIIDRKKNIFKLAQGEYVAAEKIEMAIGKHAAIGQFWVYGNSYLSKLVAVVVPDFSGDAFANAAQANGFYNEDKVAMAQSDACKEYFLGEVTKSAKAAKLKSFEVPKAVLVEGDVDDLGQGFSVDNDCMTPTFKLKRPQLLKRYEEDIKKMYKSLGEEWRTK